ncbi:4-hydroxybenzoate octaprenyltransferase [Sphingobacteriales bacterium UPWRP_1]|nr:4-hydroxybenzoate octaprenyltransferase [Sphingobacteriales bacterium TSM_CSS]PSJ77293.1 4-hydroxybenzoate octaprenyltransferase [Sphingobacteriales bacterium UPWRP_1]
MAAIANYLSLIKFSHTVFALPFAVIGFFLAIQYFHYPFEWWKLLLVLLCMVFARSAAMSFNRWADRNIDAQNPRTALREIPGGIISPRAALVFVLLNCVFFVATTWFINPLCFYLSPVALLVVLGYSYTKRFTALCHFILGIGLGLAPVGAFLSVSARFELLPVLYGFAVLFWVSGFDIIYALQDEEFDKSRQLNSIPALLGKGRALQVSNLLHIICSAIIIGAGVFAGFGWWYWLASAVFLGLLFYQHTLVSANDLNRVNLAFFTTNGIASVVFAVLVLAELFSR